MGAKKDAISPTVRLSRASPPPSDPLGHRVRSIVRSRLFGEAPPPAIGGYEIDGQLGAGGMGVVYRAHTSGGEQVAIKTVQTESPHSIKRLKREFRSLTRVRHPGVVRFIELLAGPNGLHYVMELVDGVTLGQWLEAGQPRDLGDILAIFGQICEAVQAIHAAGLVHRDLKPNNVMVTPAGRAVVLDLGLAREHRTGLNSLTNSGVPVGTPMYMAPEQMRAEPSGPGCDWYAVGAMLFEALAGRLPWTGRTFAEIADRKKRPLDLKSLRPGTPPDLSSLVSQLVSHAPQHRAGYRELRRVLDAWTQRDIPAPQGQSSCFLGRERELAVLNSAAAQTASGAPASVTILGEGGIGKTSLVDKFATELPGWLLLQARCSPHEEIPYRAVDAALDSLSTWLGSMSVPDAERYLPSNVGLLARVFPALSDVPAIARRPNPQADLTPREARRGAFDALRELLGKIATHNHLLLTLDDLQWVDADSLALLRHVLSGPAAPPMLTILSSRPDMLGLEAVRLLAGPRPGAREHKSRIDLGPLTEKDGTQLLESWLTKPQHRTTLAMVHESGGNPFVLRVLALEFETESSPRHVRRVGDVVRARTARLPRSAQRAARLLTLAGGSLPESVLSHATGPDSLGALRALCDASLAKHGVARGARTVELAHDRITESLLPTIEHSSAVELHASLAGALEHGDSEPAVLAYHYARAGRPLAAARLHLCAARQARTAVAFDRTAEQLLAALRVGELQGWMRGIVEQALAVALGNAGQPHEAAQAYLRAADHLPESQAISARCLGAELLLHCGHVSEGEAVLTALTRAVGLRQPSGPVAVVFHILGARMAARVATKRAVADPTRARLQFEVCWTAARGLPELRGAQAYYFHSVGLKLARWLGDPARLALSTANEAGLLATIQGERALPRVRMMLEEANHLAAVSGDEFVRVYVREYAGEAMLACGRWEESSANLRDAVELYRGGDAGIGREILRLRAYHATCANYLGRMTFLRHEAPALLEETQSVAAPFPEMGIRTAYAHLVSLADDDPDRSMRLLEPVDAYTLDKFPGRRLAWAYTRGAAHRYSGDHRAAWDVVCDERRALARSDLMRVPVYAAEYWTLLAQAALANLAENDHAELLREATRAIARLERVPTRTANASAIAARAALAFHDGNVEDSCTFLQDARTRFAIQGMRAHASAAAHLLRRLGGEQEPGEDEAASFASAESIRCPATFYNTLLPGFVGV